MLLEPLTRASYCTTPQNLGSASDRVPNPPRRVRSAGGRRHGAHRPREARCTSPPSSSHAACSDGGWSDGQCACPGRVAPRRAAVLQPRHAAGAGPTNRGQRKKEFAFHIDVAFLPRRSSAEPRIRNAPALRLLAGAPPRFDRFHSRLESRGPRVVKLPARPGPIGASATFRLRCRRRSASPVPSIRHVARGQPSAVTESRPISSIHLEDDDCFVALRRDRAEAERLGRTTVSAQPSSERADPTHRRAVASGADRRSTNQAGGTPAS